MAGDTERRGPEVLPLTRRLREPRVAHGTGWVMVLMNFVYGISHAAGPGHGKAVLTTYLLTDRQQIYRGVAMGTVAARLQGLTVRVLVYGLIDAGRLTDMTRSLSAGELPE